MLRFARKDVPRKRHPLVDGYSRYGREIEDYESSKHLCLSILFGHETVDVEASRIELCKRFLECVYKLPALYLDGGLETSGDFVEYVDLFRCMLLCSLPVAPESVGAVRVTIGLESEQRILQRQPLNMIGGIAPGGQMVLGKHRGLSLREHSWVGTLFGLLKDSYVWTTSFEDVTSKKYQQFRLDLNGISPSTLLMFCSMGSVECLVHDDEESFAWLCPKPMVNIEGFNQRMITDLARLWNLEEEKKKAPEGMMQVMYREKMSVCWGNVPYVLYPHVEHAVEKPVHVAGEERKEDEEGGGGGDGVAAAIKDDPEAFLLPEDRFSITSLIRHGDKKDYIFVGDRHFDAYDVDFDSICVAYRAVFGTDFHSVYHLDGRVQLQAKGLMAMGCLIKDVDKLCDGFRDPETNFAGLFRYLEKRVSNAMQERRDRFFPLLTLGRSIPETFLRIRLMFRYLLGETVMGIVDGCCRLTALAYCWLGLRPEQGTKSGLNGRLRAIGGRPNYNMMTSPSPVSLIMGGTSYRTKDVGPICAETLEFVEVYSCATQSSFENAQGLSIQSVLLTILRQYQEGLPFHDEKYRALLRNMDASDVYFSEEELFGVGAGGSLTPAKREKNISNRIRQYIFHTIGLTPQTDIHTAWGSGGSSRDADEKKSFLWKVDLMKVNGSVKILNDILCRFLLLVGVVRVEDVAQSRNAYAKEFLELLIMFVTNNGKSWQEEGEAVRGELDCITNPLRIHPVVESKMLEKLEDVQKLDSDWSQPDRWEMLSQPDPNRNTDLMVSALEYRMRIDLLVWMFLFSFCLFPLSDHL